LPAAVALGDLTAPREAICRKSLQQVSNSILPYGGQHPAMSIVWPYALREATPRPELAKVGTLADQTYCRNPQGVVHLRAGGSLRLGAEPLGDGDAESPE
jgi:hypothetical protein